MSTARAGDAHGHPAHGHPAHGRTAAARHRGRLTAVLVISTVVLLTEAVGGLLTGSLALLADAGHVLTDVAGIATVLFAVSLAARRPTDRRSFGWQRAEVLAAMANALLLLVVGTAILVEAVRRLADPAPVAPGGVVAVGLLGLVANGVSAALLADTGDGGLATRPARLEVLNDALGSVVVLVSAGVIALTGWERADAVASLAVAALIAPRAWSLSAAALHVLLEGTPVGVDAGDVRGHLLRTPGVVAVHDLHVWTITSGVPVVTAHVVVADDAAGPQLLDGLQDCLRTHFAIGHSTFQLEPAGHADHEDVTHA